MASSAGLVRHLRSCWVDDLEPNLAAADAKLWFLALSRLIDVNLIEAAAYAALRLVAAFPAVASFKRSALLLRKTPAAVEDAGFANFVDEPGREVQIVRRQGATTALFAFTGRFGGLGLPMALVHRWLALTGAHVVYLRDPSQTSFCSGVPTLGRDVAQSVTALHLIAADLGATDLACYGNSSGGYAALLYGLDLQARRVLAVGAWTDLSPHIAVRIKDRVNWTAGLDLRPLYLAAPRRPTVRLVYGADNPDDRANARHLAGVESVTLHGVAGWQGHDPQVGLIAQDQFGLLMAELGGAPEHRGAPFP